MKISMILLALATQARGDSNWDSDAALDLLQINKHGVSFEKLQRGRCQNVKGYNKPQNKDPADAAANTERLFKYNEQQSVDECHATCAETEGCKYFSFAERSGNKAPICTGCTSIDNYDQPTGDEDKRGGNRGWLYKMEADAPPSPPPPPPVPVDPNAPPGHNPNLCEENGWPYGVHKDWNKGNCCAWITPWFEKHASWRHVGNGRCSGGYSITASTETCGTWKEIDEEDGEVERQKRKFYCSPGDGVPEGHDPSQCLTYEHGKFVVPTKNECCERDTPAGTFKGQWGWAAGGCRDGYVKQTTKKVCAKWDGYTYYAFHCTPA